MVFVFVSVIVIVVVLCVAVVVGGNVGQFLSPKCSALEWPDSELDSLTSECVSACEVGEVDIAAAVLSNTFSSHPVAPIAIDVVMLVNFVTIFCLFTVRIAVQHFFLSTQRSIGACVYVCVEIFPHFCY